MAGLSPAQLDAMEKKPVAAAPKTGGLTAADLDRMASGHTSSPAVTENPFVHGVKQVGTGIGNALDAQRWAAARLLTGKTDTGEQRTAERTGAGLQGVYEGLGRIPVVGHALQGASDVLQDTLTDPLTYETAGAGPVLKALGITAKVAPKIGEAVKAVSDTPLGSLLHDTLNWGGQVTRERGAGTTNTIRGALNRGSMTGTKTEQQYRRLSQGILNGLSDDEKMNVRRGLNGESVASAKPVYRVQSRPGDPEVSPSRNATYFAHTPEEAKSLASVVGNQGEHLIERTASAKNPLDLHEESAGGLLPAVMSKVGMKFSGLESWRTTQAQTVAALPSLLKSIGVSEAEIPRLMADPLAAEERAATEIARKHGYDAIQTQDEYISLHPEAHSKSGLSVKEQVAVKNLRRLTELDFKQRSRTMMAQKLSEAAGQLKPEQHAALATAIRTGVRPAGEVGDMFDALKRQVGEAMPYRQNYAPTVHEPTAPHEAGTEAKTVSPAEAFDTRNLQRENVPTTEPGQLSEGFEALASNAGRQAQKRVIHESLGDLVNDPAIKSLISDTIKATGEKRTNVQKVGDAWLKVIGYPRAATVSLTPRHAVNILDLAANTVPPQEFPGYMKNVTALAAKLVKADEKQYANLVRGTSSVSQNFAEHKPFFQNVPGLKHWTALNNKLVWAVDTAAKVEYEKILKKMHPEMSDLEAGGTASKRLVDYEHVSPAVKALRYVAPFGTFRGSIPGAVLGGIARNPARAALLNRATGGTMYGSRPDKGQHGVTLYNPTADIGRGLDAPQDFLRGTLGAPVQGAATLGLEAATGNPGASIRTIGQELKDLPGQIMRGQFSKMGTPGKVSPYAKAVALRTARYLNYGNVIDLRWLVDQAAAGLPEAQAAVEQIGASQFKAPTGSGMERFEREALRQAGGVGIR